MIGIDTRFPSEKGVEMYRYTLPHVKEKHPKIKVLVAGQYEGV